MQVNLVHYPGILMKNFQGHVTAAQLERFYEVVFALVIFDA